jgi:hypothetical protein
MGKPNRRAVHDHQEGKELHNKNQEKKTYRPERQRIAKDEPCVSHGRGQASSLLFQGGSKEPTQ